MSFVPLCASFAQLCVITLIKPNFPKIAQVYADCQVVCLGKFTTPLCFLIPIPLIPHTIFQFIITVITAHLIHNNSFIF